MVALEAVRATNARLKDLAPEPFMLPTAVGRAWTESLLQLVLRAVLAKALLTNIAVIPLSLACTS